MNFIVKEWMIDLVIFVEPDMTVMDALATMRRRYIHSLIVRKSETKKEYGILTSTDISDKIIAHEKNPSEVTVQEVMTSPLITVRLDERLVDCAKKMKEHHIHHLPVVNDDGDIVGMISDTDFLVAAEAMGHKPGDRII